MKKPTYLHIISIFLTALLLLGSLPIFALSGAADGLPLSAYSKYLFRVTATESGYMFMNHSSGNYISKDSNITYTALDKAVAWTLTASGKGYTVRRAGASATSSTACFSFGSSNRIGLKADDSACVVNFYELKSGDKFEKASGLPESGKDYLIVYDDGEKTFALSDEVVNPGAYERIQTYSLTIPEYTGEEPVESFYAKCLFVAAEYEGGLSFYNASADKYLTRNGNANMGNETAFTIESVSNGVNIRIDESNYLHFGSNNRCSFGTASLFVFYEQIEEELFEKVDLPEAGKTYLIVHPEGTDLFVLSNEVIDNSRVQTYALKFSIKESDEPEPFDYSPYLFTAGAVDSGFTFYNAACDKFMTKTGNANMGDATVFVVIETETGVQIRLLTDDSTVSGFLHFGSSNRCSFGAPTEFRLFEHVKDDTFIEVTVPKNGKDYMIVTVKNGTNYSLSNEVYSSGSSARLQCVSIPFTVVEAEYAHRLWKLTEDENGNWIFKNVGGKDYLTCTANADIGSAKTPFVLTAQDGGFVIALAEDTGVKTAGDALHCGTGQKCSFGTADIFFLYEHLANDTFRKVTAPTSGKEYLVVFEKNEKSYALIDTAESSRVLTQETVIPLAPEEPTGPDEDLNNDGSVTIADVTALLDYLAGNTSAVTSGNPDLDGSTDVTISDVTKLLDYLAGLTE